MLPACRTAGDEFAIPTFDLTPRDVAGFTNDLQWGCLLARPHAKARRV
jgi:hypothetical protein